MAKDTSKTPDISTQAVDEWYYEGDLWLQIVEGRPFLSVTNDLKVYITEMKPSECLEKAHAIHLEQTIFKDTPDGDKLLEKGAAIIYEDKEDTRRR